MLKKSKKIIIDTDPGIDDAMAILFAHAHPGIELVGLTTVFGNATVERVTHNALYLRKRFDLNCDVAKGVAKPLQGEPKPPVSHIHGDNGLGNVALSEDNLGSIDARAASDYLIEKIIDNPNEITLIPIGPLTNLALALEKAPHITKLVKEVIIMGGAFGYNGHSGNVTPVAEANIYCDPWAADKVLTADWPVTIVGLDVTQQVIMSPEYFAALQSQGERGQFIYDIAQFYLDFYRSNGAYEGCATHDPLAVMYAIAPDLFETICVPVRVVPEGISKGQTLAKTVERGYGIDEWQTPKQTICTQVDAEACLALYAKVMR